MDLNLFVKKEIEMFGLFNVLIMPLNALIVVFLLLQEYFLNQNFEYRFDYWCFAINYVFVVSRLAAP